MLHYRHFASYSSVLFVYLRRSHVSLLLRRIFFLLFLSFQFIFVCVVSLLAAQQTYTRIVMFYVGSLLFYALLEHRIDFLSIFALYGLCVVMYGNRLFCFDLFLCCLIIDMNGRKKNFRSDKSSIYVRVTSMHHIQITKHFNWHGITFYENK